MCTNILTFTSRLTFISACRNLTSSSKSALVCILQKLYLLNNNSLELFLKLFDAQVQPVAHYGSELWSLVKATMRIKRFICTLCLKGFLGVDMKIPNDLVFGEADRFFFFFFYYTEPEIVSLRSLSSLIEVCRQMYSLLPYAYMYG